MGNSDQSIRRNGLIIGTFTVIICIGIGLYFYNSFFRQSNAQLIETVPTDASFIFEINGMVYIYRHPGDGTDSIISRKNEKNSLQILEAK